MNIVVREIIYMNIVVREIIYMPIIGHRVTLPS